jgi:hypothetical protein
MSIPCARSALVLVILWFFPVIPFLTGKAGGRETSAIITFTAFEAAFYCEIMRSGIQSVPRSRRLRAAQALGLTPTQTMVHVVLPQALRNMLPVSADAEHRAVPGHLAGVCHRRQGSAQGRRRGGQELQSPGGDDRALGPDLLRHLFQPLAGGFVSCRSALPSSVNPVRA